MVAGWKKGKMKRTAKNFEEWQRDCSRDDRPGENDKTATETSTTRRKITEITEAMRDLLLYKNERYGDSALNPKQIFYKGDATNSILIRLDDKLGRIMANTDKTPRMNDVADIIGYCTLLLVGMGATAKDIEKFKD